MDVCTPYVSIPQTVTPDPDKSCGPYKPIGGNCEDDDPVTSTLLSEYVYCSLVIHFLFVLQCETSSDRQQEPRYYR